MESGPHSPKPPQKTESEEESPGHVCGEVGGQHWPQRVPLPREPDGQIDGVARGGGECAVFPGGQEPVLRSDTGSPVDTAAAPSRRPSPGGPALPAALDLTLNQSEFWRVPHFVERWPLSSRRVPQVYRRSRAQRPSGWKGLDCHRPWPAYPAPAGASCRAQVACGRSHLSPCCCQLQRQQVWWNLRPRRHCQSHVTAGFS